MEPTACSTTIKVSSKVSCFTDFAVSVFYRPPLPDFAWFERSIFVFFCASVCEMVRPLCWTGYRFNRTAGGFSIIPSTWLTSTRWYNERSSRNDMESNDNENANKLHSCSRPAGPECISWTRQRNSAWWSNFGFYGAWGAVWCLPGKQ